MAVISGTGGGFSNMDPITVRAELGIAGRTLRMRSEEIWGELTRLRSDVDNVLSHWKGGSSQMYTDLKMEWDFAANGLFNDVLGQIAQAMDINWANYQETEFENARTWRAVNH
jgi:WXG100 family type VII secretion target